MRLERQYVIRMGNFVSVMRHPQHGNILLADVTMNDFIDVALVGIIERAGDLIEQ